MARVRPCYELAMRRRRSITAAVLALALVGAAACGGDADDEAQPTDATAERGGPTAAAGGAPGVVLEDAGEEPREPLRLRLTAGTTTRAALLNKTELGLSIEGNRVPGGALPAMRTVMEQRIDRVDAGGTADYTVTFTDWTVEPTPEADPEAVRQIQRVFEELDDLRTTGTVDASGRQQAVSVDTSRVSDPLLKSTLESVSSQVGNLAAPFPAEPVGPGARWRSTSTATISGITMNTTMTYTLRSRTGDRYELDLVQDAEAPSGPIDLPNVPADIETSIERFVFHTTGRLAGELTAHLPSTSTLRGEGEGRLIGVAQGERATLVQRVKLEATLSPA